MKYIIIDSNAVIHRAFHALPPFRAKDGSPTGAVYGFTAILLKIIKEMKPDYILAAFDTASPTFRHIAYERYKAQREKTPQELEGQFEKTKEILRAFKIPVLEKDGYEADDIIGTLAVKIPLADKKAEIIIVTGDMDTFQLINKRVSVYTMRRGLSDTILYDEKSVKERFGFSPERMIDYKALRGDPSDNIPGVRGVGEKTASDLIKKYGTIKKIYELLKKGKLKESSSLLEKLKKSEKEAFFSKELATIQTKTGIPFEIGKAEKPENKATPEIKAVFEKFGFKSFYERLTGTKTEPEKEKTTKKETAQTLAFSENSSDKKQNKKLKTAGSQKALNELLSEKEAAFFFNEDKKELMAFDGENILEIKERDWADIKTSAGMPEECLKIIFDAKPFIKYFSEKTGITPQKNFFDLKIAGFLLDADGRKMTPPELINAYLNKMAGLEPKQWLKDFFELRKILEKKLKEENAWRVFSEIEMPLTAILAEMEKNGIKIDVEYLEKLNGVFQKNLEELTGEIYRLADAEFNINSPGQLADILFQKLRIGETGRSIKRTAHGKLSTDQEQLSELSGEHPVIPKILEYREIMKLKSTYSDALPRFIGKDGRLHTTFDQTGTVTGRLSSSDPNLQNIPAKTKLGREIRRAFAAEKGYCFLSFDYSQLQLRIAAQLSQDQKMLEAFSKNLDIHKMTAAEINNVAEEKVTAEMRREAKTLNFGILYGMGQRAFAKSAGITGARAKKFFEEYFQKFGGIKNYMEKTIETAGEKGFVETYFGRRRYLPGIAGGGFRVEKESERMAVNTPIQGTEAEIVKLAMIKVSELIKNRYNERDIRLILQIHDELLFEAADRKELLHNAAAQVKSIMEGAWEEMPLKVEVKRGYNWAEMTLGNP